MRSQAESMLSEREARLAEASRVGLALLDQLAGAQARIADIEAALAARDAKAASAAEDR
jgi:hypothetical protein